MITRILGTVLLCATSQALCGCALFRTPPPVYDPVVFDSGLRIRDLVVPEGGRAIQNGDTITIDYRLSLEGGDEIESTQSTGQPLTFEVGAGELPAGLEKGVVGMRLYGSRRITVPPALAYGDEGLPPRIPPDATLVFEVEVARIDDELMLAPPPDDDPDS